MVGPTLTTSRLILRPPSSEDFEGFVAFMSDPETANFVGGVQNREATWRGFTCMAGAWTVWGFSMFSVIERDTGRWIGRLGPWRPEGWPGNEIGWGLVRSAWGKGYATEGAKAAIDWAFTNLGWTEIIHCINPDNRASQEVARRLGSTLRGQGQLPAPYNTTPMDIWGQTRDQWLERADR